MIIRRVIINDLHVETFCSLIILFFNLFLSSLEMHICGAVLICTVIYARLKLMISNVYNFLQFSDSALVDFRIFVHAGTCPQFLQSSFQLYDRLKLPLCRHSQSCHNFYALEKLTIVLLMSFKQVFSVISLNKRRLNSHHSHD